MAFATTLNAQSTASASASATIVTPISIAKNVDMNFGNIAVTATAGTVVLASDGTRTKTGGVTLPATVGTVTAASFLVSGQANYTYSITLPSAAVVLTSNSNTMNATAFTSNIAATAGALSTTGSQTLNVGATLSVAASQPAGTYTTATPFDVTVNYN